MFHTFVRRSLFVVDHSVCVSRVIYFRDRHKHPIDSDQKTWYRHRYTADGMYKQHSQAIFVDLIPVSCISPARKVANMESSVATARDILDTGRTHACMMASWVGMGTSLIALNRVCLQAGMGQNLVCPSTLPFRPSCRGTHTSFVCVCVCASVVARASPNRHDGDPSEE